MTILRRCAKRFQFYNQLSEDQKRLAIRNEIREYNKSLAEATKNAGVIEPRERVAGHGVNSNSAWGKPWDGYQDHIAKDGN